MGNELTELENLTYNHSMSIGFERRLAVTQENLSSEMSQDKAAEPEKAELEEGKLDNVSGGVGIGGRKIPDLVCPQCGTKGSVVQDRFARICTVCDYLL